MQSARLRARPDGSYDWLPEANLGYHAGEPLWNAIARLRARPDGGYDWLPEANLGYHAGKPPWNAIPTPSGSSR